MNTDRCAINFCPREPGTGTHTRIRLPEGGEAMVAVCENHWQAIRAVSYDAPPLKPS